MSPNRFFPPSLLSARLPNDLVTKSSLQNISSDYCISHDSPQLIANHCIHINSKFSHLANYAKLLDTSVLQEFTPELEQAVLQETMPELLLSISRLSQMKQVVSIVWNTMRRSQNEFETHD
ncbi:hypothetical protein AVEN_251055-1 [Araneus ventricosus]|uniref:Uncharacterized protein n=1 Tax=Araneus ventricosus TaxID=182803 RepID=A0A4Y2DMS1_ARAVE|nr:hypothetical protein AVEN_251055-1 [Araneus ventricosus]